MADLALKHAIAGGPIRDVSAWDRLKVNREWLGLWFMLPAAAFLLLFLAYPLGLGVWLSFTDARIGRGGEFIGLENYEWLWDDSVFWLSVFNTLLYTCVASVCKFAIGLYLALLLNHNMPFKAIIRALVLIPFIVPTALSAIAFWWIYDSQFSIISWALMRIDRKSTRLNSSHGYISYAVFCLKKKKITSVLLHYSFVNVYVHHSDDMYSYRRT